MAFVTDLAVEPARGAGASLRQRLVVLYALLGLANVLVWLWAWAVFRDQLAELLVRECGQQLVLGSEVRVQRGRGHTQAGGEPPVRADPPGQQRRRAGVVEDEGGRGGAGPPPRSGSVRDRSKPDGRSAARRPRNVGLRAERRPALLAPGAVHRDDPGVALGRHRGPPELAARL